MDISREVRVFALYAARFDIGQVIMIVFYENFIGHEFSFDGQIAAYFNIACRFQCRYIAERVVVHGNIVDLFYSRHIAVFNVDAVYIRTAACIIADIGRFVFHLADSSVQCRIGKLAIRFFL